MCGISGIISFTESRLDPQIARVMSDQLIHRGPDDSDYYHDDFVALGHRRLSIIDLEGGKQPIYNEDHSVVLIFNGEIYNFLELRSELQKRGHTLYTRTDSEVIVHLYEDLGIDCLRKLSGMFAFALWDKKRRRLFLARDRVGIKPLVYCQNRGKLLFASEINSILASGLVSKQLDLAALNLYFTFGYVPAPWTIYQKIRKLQPGHYMVVENGKVRIEKYWRIRAKESPLTLEEARRRLLELLRDSVKNHMISDVPVGAFLSGGLDSSAVVALMSEFSNHPITTCTVGYEHNKFYDETAFADEVAAMYGTEHHTYFLSKNDLLKIIPTLISKLGEPFADESLVPTYAVSQKMSESAKVTLSGDGADELFAGYNKYLGEYWYQYFARIPAPLTENIIKPILEGLPASRKNVIAENIRKSKRFMRGLGDDSIQRHFHWMEIFSEDVRAEIMNHPAPNLGQHIIRNLFEETTGNNGKQDLINRLLEVDFRFILPNDMLTKVDLASMWNSLEVRVPFLDHRFVEFVFSLKGSDKLHGRNRKAILKRAVKGLVPKSTLKRAKYGFDVPIGEWFRKELKSTFLETINEADIKKYGILNHKTICDIFEKHLNHQDDYTRQLWSIFLFQSWLNHTQVSP